MAAATADHQALAAAHLHVAGAIAYSWWRRGAPVELEELRAIASLALVESARRYDPANGASASFHTFAAPHMNGAIADELRRRGGRHETSARRRLRSVSLDALPEDATPREDDPASALTNRIGCEQQAAVALAVLAPRERLVIWLRYFDGQTQARTADILGVSESRISQLENAAKLRMRQTLTRAA